MHVDVTTAKNYLERIKMLDCLIENKLAEKQKTYDMITRVVPNMDGMPRGFGVSDKVGNGVVKLVQLEKEIDRLIDQYVHTKKQVQNIIEQLPVNQYNVLYKHYFEYKTYEQIANELPCSLRHVYRLMDKALKNLSLYVKEI